MEHMASNNSLIMKDSAAVPMNPDRHVGLVCQIVVTISYVLGIFGNIAALCILHWSARIRNRKHTIMLRCLAINDLIAVMGMLGLMYFQLYGEKTETSEYWSCVMRVFWRAFGLGSGCVAIVMAVERWLALTRPFVCQQYVTPSSVHKSILFLWAFAIILTCMPLLGFGLYYNKDEKKCYRYRDGKTIDEIAYSYLFFSFGTMLCICIVFCNLAVMIEVARMGRQGEKILVRRVSRSFIKQNKNCVLTNKKATAEELAFAKMMAILCISFVICWMPQMISIPMAQFYPGYKPCQLLFRIADILMALHFTLDPYVYVLLRYRKRSGNGQTGPNGALNLTSPTTLTTQTTTTALLQPKFP